MLNATQNYEYYQQILRLESRAAYRFLFIIDLGIHILLICNVKLVDKVYVHDSVPDRN